MPHYIHAIPPTGRVRLSYELDDEDVRAAFPSGPGISDEARVINVALVQLASRAGGGAFRARPNDEWTLLYYDGTSEQGWQIDTTELAPFMKESRQRGTARHPAVRDDS